MADHHTEALIFELEHAKGVLVEYGWIQGAMGTKDRGYCALGAINASRTLATITSDPACHSPAQFAEALLEQRGYTCSNDGGLRPLANWNDNVATSINDVIGLFDDTIIYLKEQPRD